MSANILKEASPSDIQSEQEHGQGSGPESDRGRIPVAHPSVVTGDVAHASRFGPLREGYARQLPRAASQVGESESDDCPDGQRPVRGVTEEEEEESHDCI